MIVIQMLYGYNANGVQSRVLASSNARSLESALDLLEVVGLNLRLLGGFARGGCPAPLPMAVDHCMRGLLVMHRRIFKCMDL